MTKTSQTTLKFKRFFFFFSWLNYVNRNLLDFFTFKIEKNKKFNNDKQKNDWIFWSNKSQYSWELITIN